MGTVKDFPTQPTTVVSSPQPSHFPMKLTHFALTGLFLLIGAGIYLTMKTDMDGRMEEMRADNDRKFELLQKAIKEGQQAAQKPAAMVAEVTDSVQGKLEAAAGNAAAQVENAAARVSKDVDAAVKDVLGKADPKATEALNNVKEAVGTGAGKAADAVANAAEKVVGTVAEAPADLASPDAAMLEKEQDVLKETGAPNVEALPEEPQGQKLTKLQSTVLNLPAIARIKKTEEAAGFVVLDRGQAANLAKGDSFAVRRGTAVIGRVTLTDTILENESVADVDSSKLVTGIVLQPGDELIDFGR